MKNIFTLGIFCLAMFAGNAQTDVYLNINHKLGAAPFSSTTTAQNNKGSNFQLQRLDYYISQIKLPYDGGQDTLLADLYIMVKGSIPVNQLLGNFTITNLESIEFGIGVDGSKNHSDPSTYPAAHALSFQAPSMHWGWAAGYRFAALEGKTGASMNQSWQLHALGDKNYGFASVSTTGTMNNGDLYINLDADYTEALRDITVSGSLNYHGEDQVAPTLLQNFQDHVFSEAVSSIGVEEQTTSTFSIAPNPSSGLTTLWLNDDRYDKLKVRVSDLSGRLLMLEEIGSEPYHTLEVRKAGIYLVQLVREGEIISTQRLVVQKS